MENIIVKSLITHDECVKCEGIFQLKERVYLDILNQSYCEVCYKVTYESE